MIFNNCGKSLNNYLFRYGADESERFKSYKYLGLMTSPFGNFNLARQALKKAALKAFWSKKNQKLIGTDRIRRSLDESTLCRHRNCKHHQATT